LEPVAGNGLLHRRLFLTGAIGATGLAAGSALAEPLAVPVWSTTPGSRGTGYGEPSRFERVARGPVAEKNPLYGAGISGLRSPLQFLEGMITPSGLHFEVTHNGVPDIDPAQHFLVIHGLVKRPLKFSLERLSRYPMTSRIMFLECAGNSGALYQPKAVPGSAQTLHGLVSCSEWTGVPLSILLDEAGVDPKAQWIMAEGADPGLLSRSVPMVKVMKDAMVALYQNGERIRPTNGYPMRLLVPGFQGNMNIKWLRRIEVTAGPSQTMYETSRYSLLLADGKAAQFKFQLDAKSVITRPSPGYQMQGPGFYEITGVAWSGNGAVKKVEVSADGGKSWAETTLSGPVLPVALTRFRLPWKWDGGPAVLQSRVTDTTGYVQPTRDALVAARGTKANYHNNAITSWNVARGGELTHVYA
jgi:sulfane dehydrogenase subunit SoxC